MTIWFSPLLFLIARCTENELRRHIEFLKAENEMLRSRVPKQRIFLKDHERQRLLELGRAIRSGVTKLITIVHPRTWLRWLQIEKSGKPKKKMGRPGLNEKVRELVIRLARENRWVCGRILGELKKLRIRYISKTTIRNILKEEGLPPEPKRGNGTWSEFLNAHLDSLWQIDFFSKMIWTPTGLRQVFVLAFMHVGSRRVFCTPCTFKPHLRWMVSQACELVKQAEEAKLSIKYMVRDRDGIFVEAFERVFTDGECEIVKTAVRAPNQNAFIERWVNSIKFEVLNHFIVLGERHFDHLVSEYLEYYNSLRPHQGLENRPLTGDWPEVEEPLTDDETIVCHERLSGIIKHYERRAA